MEYSAENRGTIQNRERAKQIIDFHGLQYGRITPTDIDGLFEYKNLAYVLLEFKYGNADMPFGQKIALERMCDDFQAAGKKAILLLCRHEIEDCRKDIPAIMIPVSSRYYEHKWKQGDGRNVKQYVDSFIRYVDETERGNMP